MLHLARRAGVKLLDTAHAYGDAEEVIGEQGVVVNEFKIVTKTVPVQLQNVTEWDVSYVSERFLESLKRLQCSQVYGLLVHDADVLLTKNGNQLWSALQEFKEQGQVEKIGVSVYDPEQLGEILDSMQIDLVQLPFNIYDQRFEQSGLLQRLHETGIEVHARSAFLQGLLLMLPDQLPRHFTTIHSHHNRLHQHFKEKGVGLVGGCLSYCLSQPNIDQVIVGCESLEQLSEILNVAEKDDQCLLELESYSLNDESIINPSKWSN